MRAFQRQLIGFFILCFSGSYTLLSSDKIQTLHLTPTQCITRADLQYIQSARIPKAVLVLCPGVNQTSEKLISFPEWILFARENDLGLVGLSFASPVEAIENGTGYYSASIESGDLLLQGIRTIYGKDIPLLLYGRSGGAHFTSRFVEWTPTSVLAWCAYSAAWWDTPLPSGCTPPGIVACGDKDQRYGASLHYFKQGRAVGKPWLWVGLAGTGHVSSPELDKFVRRFFEFILKQPDAERGYVDIDSENLITASEAQHQRVLSGVLPSKKLFSEWRLLHEP